MNFCWLSNSLYKSDVWGGRFVSEAMYEGFKFLDYHIDLRSWKELHPNYAALQDYDVIFTLDSNFSPQMYHLAGGKATTVFWAIDDPRCHRAPAPGFDCFFTHSRGSVKLHEDLGRTNVHYLPLGYNPEVFKKIHSSTRSQNLCYVGNGLATKSYRTILEPAREHHGDELLIFGKDWNKPENIKYRKHVIMAVVPEAVNMIYNQTKIVLNMHTQDQRTTDCTFIMRDFEARAAGAFVLSDTFEGQEFFGKHQCFSDSPAETKELIRYYLENDEEREKIAREGYDTVVKGKNTYRDRCREIRKIQGDETGNQGVG